MLCPAERSELLTGERAGMSNPATLSGEVGRPPERFWDPRAVVGYVGGLVIDGAGS